ncbi:hypothetical protein OS493_012079 [Desmophyllum pertusum]|uniref:Uncharacterized protein n=1 Tax=Desmophyllum pertusum TaxID=174260 RepID=A0A9X0A2Y6_9CNID|nr:hypothetical protein OS493_012079 [Desmophyllum pertusum]
MARAVLSVGRELWALWFTTGTADKPPWAAKVLNNYRICKQGNFVPVKAVFDDFLNNGSEKENCQLQGFEVGRILKEVFPDI